MCETVRKVSDILTTRIILVERVPCVTQAHPHLELEEQTGLHTNYLLTAL